MISIIKLEIRRSAMKWWCAPLAAAYLTILFRVSDSWMGVWSNTSTYSGVPIIYVGPLLGAVVAWSAARRIKTRLYEYTRMGSRSLNSFNAALYIANFALAIVPYLIGVVAAAISTSRSTSVDGFLWGAYICYSLCLVVVCVSIGHLIGMYAGSPIVAPILAGLVCLIVSFYAKVPINGSPWLEISPARLILMIVCSVVLVGASVSMPARLLRATERSRREEVERFAGCFVVGLCAVGLVGGRWLGPIQIHRAAPDNPACSDSSPEVCVWPEHQNHLDELVSMAERAERTAGGLLPVPETFTEFGLTDAGIAHTFRIGGPQDGLWSAAGSMADVVQNAKFMPAYCPPATEEAGQKRRRLRQHLDGWLQARIYAENPVQGGAEPGTSSSSGEVQVVLSMSAAQQRAWASETIAAALAVPCADT